MNIKETQALLYRQLKPSVGPVEAKAMANAIIQDVKEYKPIDLVLHADRELLPETVTRMQNIANKIIDGMPMQYALEKAYFHGRYFKVDASTLIPRPETSQLIDIVCDSWANKKNLNILDIGTGTGCIAISLALDLPFSNVDAIDISAQALLIAKSNADNLRAKVNYVKADALDLTSSIVNDNIYDIIVSNPPYVLESEIKTMDERVYKYEPTTALFVPDDNPIIFYSEIGKWAINHLAVDGKMYFEINPLCANQIKSKMIGLGYKDVDILADYKGNKRFAICAK